MAQFNEATNTIITQRPFNCSPQRIFSAISDPLQLAQWWGPKGFSNRFHHFDFKIGGSWDFEMKGPDGKVYAIKKQFKEIVQNKKVVLLNPQKDHVFTLTMRLTEQKDNTLFTWEMQFESKDEFLKVKDFISKANEENFDRLEAYLRNKQGIKKAL